MADLETFREETHRWLEVNAPAAMRTPPRAPEDVCWGGKKGLGCLRKRKVHKREQDGKATGTPCRAAD